MSELSDVFGDDFADEYENEREERRQSRNRVDEETLKEICFKAVEGDGFKGSEPRFKYEADAVPHDVFLVQAPESKFHKFKRQFENGGMSVGMFHLEDVYGCNFNEDMMELVDRIEEGKHYIVVGSYSEERRTSDGEERVYKNINVRGIVPVKAAKKYAQKRKKEKQGTSVEEQKKEQSGSNSDDEDIEMDSEASDEDVFNVFKAVKNKKPEILQDVADGDEEALSKLNALVDKNTDGEVGDTQVRDVFESEIEEIDDDEEEEEDDDFDLGDIGGDEEEEDDETSTEEDTESDQSDDDGDDEDSIDDWFGE